MDAFHARYPFLRAAREAVQAAEVDLGDVVLDGGPVVARAAERVRLAVEEGTIGPPRRPRIELLSYPVARVIVSLADEPRLTGRYALAEAATAMDRFVDDQSSPTRRSASRTRLTLDRLLEEFDLQDHVERRPTSGDSASDRPDDEFAVDVGPYLELSSELSGDRWRLVNRSPRAGAVTVTRAALHELLREAIRARVEEGLPVQVPDEIATALSAEVADLRALLADRRPTRDIDAVQPDLFPPCMTGLLDRVASGEQLADHSRFALTTFLASIGMDRREIATRVATSDADEDAVRAQIAHLTDRTGPAAYDPPSCATMQAYGDCEAAIMDDLCERIGHPIEYYARRLDGDDDVLQTSSPESQ